MQHNKIENFYTFVISNDQSFIFQVLKVVDPLGENLIGKLTPTPQRLANS